MRAVEVNPLKVIELRFTPEEFVIIQVVPPAVAKSLLLLNEIENAEPVQFPPGPPH